MYIGQTDRGGQTDGRVRMMTERTGGEVESGQEGNRRNSEDNLEGSSLRSKSCIYLNKGKPPSLTNPGYV